MVRTTISARDEDGLRSGPTELTMRRLASGTWQRGRS